MGLSFDWNLPFLPLSIDTSLGGTHPFQRSRSLGGSANPGDNVAAIQSERQARLAVLQQENRIAESTDNLQFFIEQSLSSIENLHARLQNRQDRLALERERREVQLLLLELGELRRIDFLESEIARAEEDISITDEIVSLFSTELELLARVGLPDLARYHSAIIVDEGD